jgi:hypothetical protein
MLLDSTITDGPLNNNPDHSNMGIKYLNLTYEKDLALINRTRQKRKRHINETL